IDRDALQRRAREIGDLLVARLAEIQKADPRVGEIRGRGAMQAIELVNPADKAPDAGLAKAVAGYCVGQGVATLTCGTHGNVLRFLPPLAISDALIADAMGVLAEAFRSN
ncbi:MAG: aminotransferase class III-fold pyridoxal phosphate-dependent enzyme, partial [Bifidobacteriaceae bacterium]|nr:aminotransferase class III-fold pyridoxal phosphate-dependent enzyme [Bifidobacteriaceae bacterium]